MVRPGLDDGRRTRYEYEACSLSMFSLGPKRVLDRERRTVSEANGSAGSGGGYRSVTSMLGTGFLFTLGALGGTVEGEGRTRAMSSTAAGMQLSERYQRP